MKIYFEIGLKGRPSDWRDRSFVVATENQTLIAQARAQLLLPLKERNLHINGKLLEGNGGYNINGTHSFKWHIKEDEWELVEISMALCNGYPHTDVDLNIDYWLNDVARLCRHDSYIKREI